MLRAVVAVQDFSDLDYVPRHFGDIVQRSLPCAESQLKLMVHSRGEIGGCWAHDPVFNVRETSVAVATAVAQAAAEDGVARARLEPDLEAQVRHSMWEPTYRPVRPA